MHSLLKKIFANKLLVFILYLFFTLILYQILSYNPPLTTSFLEQSYKTYAYSHDDSLDDYMKHFPVDKYSKHKVQDEYFYLEKKEKYDVIKTQLRLGIKWEYQLITQMAKYIKQGSNVLDIGAHIGTHTVFFSRLLKNTGDVFAFEPQKKIFMELNANLLANKATRVKTFHYALGDKIGFVEMNQPDPDNEGGTRIGSGGDRAPLITLDSLNLKNISFIKIDVEGYEDYVLDGAIKTIKESKPIILCEIQGGYFYQNAPPEIKNKIIYTAKKLEKMGYKVRHIDGANYLAIPEGYVG